MGLEIHEVTDVGAWMAENVPGASRRARPTLATASRLPEPEATQVVPVGPVVVPALPELATATAQVRPMRCVRTPGQLVAATRAVFTRELHDQRYTALVRGVGAAEDWVLGFTDVSPVRGEVVLGPSLAQIIEEYAHALLVSAGARSYPDGKWSDLARVRAHGSELYLLWYAFSDVPCPAVLHPGARPVDVVEDLADVGFDVMRLHGPQVSRLPFAPVQGARFAVVDGALVIS